MGKWFGGKSDDKGGTRGGDNRGKHDHGKRDNRDTAYQKRHESVRDKATKNPGGPAADATITRDLANWRREEKGK